MGQRRQAPVGFSAADQIELDRVAAILNEKNVAVIPHSSRRFRRLTRLKQAGMIEMNVVWRMDRDWRDPSDSRKTLEIRITADGVRLLSDGKRRALLLLGA